MGTTVTPICGTYLCGQNKAGTWKATESRPKAVLSGRGFSITITTPGVIHLNVNRPKLILSGRTAVIHKDTQALPGRPKLILRPRHFVIQPFLAVRGLGRPTLVLKSRHVTLSLSSAPHLGRPKLILQGGTLARVGRAGLVPTVPESRPLAPTVSQSELLVPTVAQAEALTPTVVTVR